MFSKGRKKGTFRFQLEGFAGVRRVELTGDFNGWKPVRMRKSKDGKFVALVPLKPGRYEYKFIVDGRWMQDPDNELLIRNVYGTFNSLAVVS